jgi:hypothetical protein
MRGLGEVIDSGPTNPEGVELQGFSHNFFRTLSENFALLAVKKEKRFLHAAFVYPPKHP